jgi:hypothetical protein
VSTRPEDSVTHDGVDAAGVVGSPDPVVLFTVTKGYPTAEEIAALTVVLASASGRAAPEEAPAAPTRRERIRRATLRPRHMIAQRRGRL